MIRFLIKGLIRDKSRSRLPIIVVSIGVALTVLLHSYIKGFMGDTLEMNARFSYGHVKVMTRAYAEDADMNPNDLALMDVDQLQQDLTQLYPDMQWSPRIYFGGLIDAPDETGETRSQGPAMGIGLDLLSETSLELQRLDLSRSIIRGTLPTQAGEALLSEDFAIKLGVNPGDAVTLIGSTMHGGMSMHNFNVSGTISFGVDIMDRGSIIVDINDARGALDMYDAAGMIVGFLPQGYYDNDQAKQRSADFNQLHMDTGDEYSPVMKSLSQQGSMGPYVDLVDVWSVYVTMIFIIAMSLVLWNAGLLGGLRRYGEVGVRLAMGEEKGHVYRSMIIESVFIGLAGSVIGTIAGLSVSYLIQVYGINISGMMEGASLMMPSHIRTRITPVDYYLGFLPGVLSTVLGTALAGIGIYKRQTAKLFKEMEA
jgi:putative ABC transport system permease protein